LLGTTPPPPPPLPVEEPEPQLLVSPPLEISNPIQNSVSENWSGWASLFMSRSVKNLTESGEKKEDSRMEVMDIESDNEEPNLPTPPNASAAPTNPPLPTQHRPPSTKESEKEPKKKEPPRRTSESLKRETSKGGDSSRPSSPPKKPVPLISPCHPPPNMGRYVPRTTSLNPPSLGTIVFRSGFFRVHYHKDFVSGFLGYRDTSSPKGKGKGKERAPSLSVLGDQGSPVDIL
jgi:hypothetical protein